MRNMPVLTEGDTIEIIAPASRCSDKQLQEMQDLFESWHLHCIVPDDIFGKDLLCANNDEARFKHLEQALLNPHSKAIVCARGGYGSMRLIPALTHVKKPERVKLFVGMSDITALHLYLQQQWNWPSIHGAAAPDRFSPKSLASLKAMMFGRVKQVEYAGLTALNHHAQKNQVIQSTLVGGNLSIIQAGIGTNWAIDGRDKIILIEETGERGYRVDRMLEHLTQAKVFHHAAALLFADFLEGKEPNNSSLIDPVLYRFAEQCPVPVVRIQGIGHGYHNAPIPLGTDSTLQLGTELTLICAISQVRMSRYP